jgi:beta-mannosidase
MGAIYCSLNDCWPVVSWSSVDYTLRWKALHYAAKRFFAPLMISAREEGELAGMDSVNVEPGTPVCNTLALCVANETIKEQACTVFWSLRDADQRPSRGQPRGGVAPMSSLWIPRWIPANGQAVAVRFLCP